MGNAAAPLAVFLAVLCGGCSLLNDNAPTIASLGRHPLKLEDTALEADERQAMAAYREFLATDDRPPVEQEERPQAMQRIADLNLEAVEEQPGPELADSTDDRLNPQEVEASILLYNEVLAQYPERADNDRVLYQLARAYERNARPDESLATLERLIVAYPDSDYRLEALFRRGEILFVLKDYPAAERAYREVAAAGASSPFHRQSLYKLGWCYFKQSLFEEGLDAFTALLDLQLQDTTAGPARLDHLERAERELLDDTLRVVSLSFSYQSGPQAVAEYYNRRGARGYEDVVYDRLGQLYLDKERFTDAALTFRTFVEHNPNHIQAPQFQMRVIETFRKGGFPTLVLEAKQEFVERYNLQGSYWQHHSPEEAGQVLGFLQTTLTDLARHFHARAQASRKPDDYRQAVHWYRTYLGSFPDAAETPGMHFLLAELLYESGDYQAATEAYIHTAYEYGEHNKAADAGYASVLAFEKQEERLTGSTRSDWHRRSIENALRFAASFPRHPQALAVTTRSAEQLLALNEPARAAAVAQQVIEAGTASAEQLRVAWTVSAHAHFDLEDYLQAEQGYQQVLARLPRDADARPAMTERLAAAIYKQGEAANAAGDTAVAVGHFLRVRTAAPTAGSVATAEYDAAAGLLSLQRWAEAAEVLERFRKDYPDDPRQSEVTRRLANAYLAEAQPLQAAAEFERIGASHGEPALRREALWQAAELYANAGESPRAIGVYTDYVRQFPQPVEPAIEARQRIAGHYRQAGNTGQQRHWLQAIITADRAAGMERTERTRFLAAQASFTLAESLYLDYRAVRLRQPLKQSLAAKKHKMETALRAYEQAADYQVAELSTAATYRTAEIYSDLAAALLDSERPADLAGEALEQYDLLLEEQAYPFEEQAISLHEANAARLDAGLYNAWIGKSLSRLAALVPARYAKLERSVTYVEAID